MKKKWIAAATAALALGGAAVHLTSAHATEVTDMPSFLTDVTQNVDAYWTAQFADAGLPEPRVSYAWIPAGQTAESQCGELGASAAAYCPADDTIYVSEQFATAIYDGSLNQQLPGSSQGYGGAVGDFAVAYLVAHEYGHQVQNELGLYDQYGSQVPTAAFELQADCYAGTWAHSADQNNQLEAGDVQEAIDAALAVGDFDASNPAHHGTPEQRATAWNTGFESGDPAACNQFLSAS